MNAFSKWTILAAGALALTANAAMAGQQIVVAQAAEKAAKVTGEAEGIVKAVDAEDHKVRLQHGPITGTLTMEGMTMPFKVAPDVDLSAIKAGDKVKFTVTRDEKGLFLIEKMAPAK